MITKAELDEIKAHYGECIYPSAQVAMRLVKEVEWLQDRLDLASRVILAATKQLTEIDNTLKKGGDALEG